MSDSKNENHFKNHKPLSLLQKQTSQVLWLWVLRVLGNLPALFKPQLLYLFKRKEQWAGGIAQWYSTCLQCTRT